MSMISRDSRIFVTGHRGLVGSAVMRYLHDEGFTNVLTATRAELDLRDQQPVSAWFREHRPEYVIHAAGTVGGIHANSTRPADFLYDNVMLHATVMRAAFETGVEMLLYLGSSCIYPRDCPQPIREDYLLTGPLERTNDAYAIAKISGLIGCQAYGRQYGCRFISAMPTNLYGPGDNFDALDSHVLPALIRRFHDAKVNQQPSVTVWGSGKPRRELLYVDDLASACLFLLERYDDASPINVGTGTDVSILELAKMVRDHVYPQGEIAFDATRPDGTPRKLLDVTRIHDLGWRHHVNLEEGIARTYAWFRQRAAADRASNPQTASV
jgi:GDP-L-fucose synthase